MARRRALKRYGPTGWQVTFHAVKRWRERIDPIGHWRIEETRKVIAQVAEESHLIPNRYAARRWVQKWGGRHLDQANRKNGVRYRYHPRAILVLGSKRCVITVFAPGEEDLASVALWEMMQHWV